MLEQAASTSPLGLPLKGRAWLKHQIAGELLIQDAQLVCQDCSQWHALCTGIFVFPSARLAMREMPQRTAPALCLQKSRDLSAHCSVINKCAAHSFEGP